MRRTLLPILLTLAGLAYGKPVKVYILAGQSNAEGHGHNATLAKNEPDLMKARDDVWCFYAGKVPGPLRPGYGFRYETFGPELMIGHVLGDAMDNEIIILKSAVGGTTLHRQWRSPSAVKRAGGEVGPLYNIMMRRAHNLLANLHDLYPPYRGQGFELGGFIWFQGENDTCAKEEDGTGFWEFYQDNLTDLIHDVRTDLGAPELPVLIIKINDACWERGGAGPVLRAAQEYVAKTVPNVAMAVTKDLDSGYHYNTPSYVTLGARSGRAMLPLATKRTATLLPPFSKAKVYSKEADVLAAGKRFNARIARGGEPDVDGLTEGLLGYWKFDEGQRREARSAQPGGSVGRIHARSQVWVRGKFGRGVKLVKNERIEFADFKEPLGPKGAVESFSVAFWLKTPCKEGPCRVGKGAGKPITFDNKNWFLSQQSNVAGWDVREFDVDGAVSFCAAFEGGVPKGIWGQPGLYGDGVEWHHVVAVYDRAEKTMTLYRDGEPNRRGATPLPDGGIAPADAPLTVGGQMLEHVDTNYQVYDELAIWSRALTEAEAKALYNGGRGAEIIVTNELERKTLPELHGILESHIDANVRHDAVAALEKRGDDARPVLMAALRDKTPFVRYRAAEALADNFGADILPDMLKALKDPDPDMRRIATTALKFLGRKAVPAAPALTRVLKDKAFDVREGAADALGAMGPLAADAVPRLVKVLRNDDEWWVAHSAYHALTRIGTADALEAVMDKLNTEKHPVMWHEFGKLREAMLASENAEMLVPLFVRWIESGDKRKVQRAADALRGLPPSAEVAPAIKKRLAAGELDDRTRRSLEDLLKRLDKTPVK